MGNTIFTEAKTAEQINEIAVTPYVKEYETERKEKRRRDETNGHERDPEEPILIDLEEVEEFRTHCAPEGRFAHYIRMVGALGGEGCQLPGFQYGDYEAAIGTGQVNLWFDT